MVKLSMNIIVSGFLFTPGAAYPAAVFSVREDWAAGCARRVLGQCEVFAGFAGVSGEGPATQQCGHKRTYSVWLVPCFWVERFQMIFCQFFKFTRSSSWPRFQKQEGAVCKSECSHSQMHFDCQQRIIRGLSWSHVISFRIMCGGPQPSLSLWIMILSPVTSDPVSLRNLPDRCLWVFHHFASLLWPLSKLIYKCCYHQIHYSSISCLVVLCMFNQ